VQSGGIGRAVAVASVKAEEPQDAQIVFDNPLPRIADETHAARGNVGKPADIVVNLAVGRHRQRVDGKIAPLGVRFPVAAEHHLGLAAEGFDVLAQRCHLERPAVDDGRHRAMLDAGRFCLETRRFDTAHHLWRHRRGRDVDLADRQLHQRIAHRTADDTGFLAVAIEQHQQAGDLSVLEPGGIVELRAGGHRVVPGTNLPPSTWAGT
jgi:hypothetical protein